MYENEKPCIVLKMVRFFDENKGFPKVLILEKKLIMAFLVLFMLYDMLKIIYMNFPEH